MREWILAFSLGVITGGFIPALPDLSITFLFLLPFVFSSYYRGLHLASAFCLGLWWLLFQAILHHDKLLPKHLEQSDLWIKGHVTGLPQSNVESTRFQFDVERMCLAERYCAESVLSAKEHKVLLSDYSGLSILPGQRWLLNVRLKRPHGFANPGGFDYEAWLFQEEIIATGTVRNHVQNKLVETNSGLSISAVFDKARYAFRQQLLNLPLETRGFISALTVGDRYFITDDDWALLSLTGTNHLMVISGLHISLVAWMAFKFTEFIFRQLPFLCLRIPANRLAAFSASAVAVIYSGFAGFSLPVQRALIMVLSLMSGQLLSRKTTPENNLCLALFLVLLIDPLAPASIGFWLSFLAVAVLLLALFYQDFSTEQSITRWFKELLRSQLFLFLGLCPVMLLFFQQVSLLAPLVNLIAIPFVGMIVVPLCLIAMLSSFINPDVFRLLISLADFSLSWFMNSLFQLTQHADFMLIKMPAVPLWLIGALWASFLLGLCCRAVYTKLLCLPFLLAVIWYRQDKPQPGAFYLDILDVGQGLAVVITTKEHVLLYDTGPAFSPRFNAGSGIIEPFLRKQNISTPDRIVISHADLDHAGGYPFLGAEYPQAEIFVGERFSSLQNYQFCEAGQQWHWDSVRFEFLYPDQQYEGNNASCVLKISTGAYSVLLPGDIEAMSELNLVRKKRDELRADVLLAPHHGSRTSSTMPMVRAVGAQYVIFSTGYLNRFNHPHSVVISRYENQQVTILDTATTGHIRIRITDRLGVNTPEIYRNLRPRFWSERYIRAP